MSLLTNTMLLGFGLLALGFLGNAYTTLSEVEA